MNPARPPLLRPPAIGKGDVIDKFIPKDRPSLILMDEVLNYVSTYRERGHHNKLYNFIQAFFFGIIKRPHTPTKTKLVDQCSFFTENV